MDTIRVLLADDHTLFRKGIRTILEQTQDIEVVGEAANGQEAVAKARELVPDAILMDIKMPVINGIDASKAILQENPHIGIVLVTMFDDPESVFAGMRAGARGYVLKEADPDELRRAIEAAYRGEVILSQSWPKRCWSISVEAPGSERPASLMRSSLSESSRSFSLPPTG